MGAVGSGGCEIGPANTAEHQNGLGKVVEPESVLKRGHRALGGKPAITRLNECTNMALPAVLERLESYTCYEIGRKTIPSSGMIRLFNRDAHLRTMAGREVTFFESLEGLEARGDGKCVVLKDFRTFRQIKMSFRRGELPPAFNFKPYKPVICPRIAGAP